MAWLVGELLFALRLAAALTLVTCTFLAAYRLAWAWIGPGAVALRWASTFAIGSWLATLGFHVLFPLGLFRLPEAVAVSLALAVGCRFVGRHRRTRELLRRDLGAFARLARGAIASPAGLAIAFFMPFVALRLSRTLFQPPLAWDSLVYHGVRAGLFVQDAGFTFEPAPGSWGLYRNYFAGAEVLSAWAMLPFHTDLLASFANGLQWLGVGLAVWALGRALGLRSPMPLSRPAPVCSSPRCRCSFLPGTWSPP